MSSAASSDPALDRDSSKLAETAGSPVTPDWDTHADGGSAAPLGRYAVRGARAGREAWTGSTDGRSLATFLGVFGLALGALELLAPRQVSRAIGLKPSAVTTGILRGMGAREVASGLGILAHPESKEWVGTRVGGDLMDLTFLAIAMLKSERPMRTLLAAGAVLGVSALDVLGTERLAEARKLPTRSTGNGVMSSHVLRSITIGCPRKDVYALWRAFENFPRFMQGIESVEPLDDKRSRWRARGPVGTTVEWESELVADEPDALIGWRSIDNSAVYHSGTVRFADAPRDLGTVVTVEMRYAPPGGQIAAGLLKMFRKEPGQQVGDDLRRLKQVLEIGEVLLSDASAGDTPRHAQPLPRQSTH